MRARTKVHRFSPCSMLDGWVYHSCIRQILELPLKQLFLKVPFSRKFDGAQNNMQIHYLKLELLKLSFVCSCFAVDFQANPTDISNKKSRKIQTTSFFSEMAYLFEPVNNTNLFCENNRPLPLTLLNWSFFTAWTVKGSKDFPDFEPD